MNKSFFDRELKEICFLIEICSLMKITIILLHDLDFLFYLEYLVNLVLLYLLSNHLGFALCTFFTTLNPCTFTSWRTCCFFVLISRSWDLWNFLLYSAFIPLIDFHLKQNRFKISWKNELEDLEELKDLDHLKL